MLVSGQGKYRTYSAYMRRRRGEAVIQSIRQLVSQYETPVDSQPASQSFSQTVRQKLRLESFSQPESKPFSIAS